uniref:F-box domain-containing protein n=1 Tax=Mycena chlorophos TaxID=658473 RepID=A0ABQ0LL05_MYCCL|nr:predicted protein [Mycena chlorophos]
MANIPAQFNVPVFTEQVQETVERELTTHEPAFTKFFTGLLFPTSGEPVFVEIPLRLGCREANSPYDLDVLWWLGVGGGPEASSVDQDATSLTLNYWPLDDPKPLKRSYTVFCVPQGLADLTTANASQPVNYLVNGLTDLSGRGWRGNLLVTRSAAHFGTKNKYEMGVTNMSERDILAIPINPPLIPSSRMSPFSELPLALLLDIIRQADWRDVVALSHTCKILRRTTKRCVAQCIASRIGRILLGPASECGLRIRIATPLLKLLDNTHAGIVGSIPLAILTLSHKEDHTTDINNLNILVPIQYAGVWYRFLIESLGFSWCVVDRLLTLTDQALRSPARRLRNEYRDHIRSFALFHRGDMTISISGTATRSLLPTLFAGRLTSQMNIITKNHIYCFYPKLTVEKKALPGWCTRSIPAYFQAHVVNAPPPLNGRVAVLPSSSSLDRPCGGECPRVWRLVQGLDGVGTFNFADEEGVTTIGQSTRLLWRLYTQPQLTVMIQSLPFDLEFLVINELIFASLLAYSAVSRRARDGVRHVLQHRTSRLLTRFDIPITSRGTLWSHLDAFYGGLTGSALLWVTQPHPTWFPADLNLVVGYGGTEPLNEMFSELGFLVETAPSRLPRVVPRPNVRAMLPYPEMSLWCPIVTYIQTPHGQTITVSESHEDSPVRLVLEAEHSLQAGVLTSTSLILLYPEHFLLGVSLLRSGGVERRSNRERSLEPTIVRARGLQIRTIFRTRYLAPCRRSTCPGLIRRLRGGRGVLVLKWSTASMHDQLGAAALNGFLDGRHALMWSWGVCENYLCEFHSQPRELRADGPFLEDSATNGHPKMTKIARIEAALKRHNPPFPHLFVALLFPTSAPSSALVSLPLDHHTTQYRTIDDLRVYSWIDARPLLAPRSPLFMEPNLVGGGVTFASSNARRVWVNGTFSIVVVLQCTAFSQRRNLLLFPATEDAGLSIHGDVLVICFEGPTIVHPSRIGEGVCCDKIRAYVSFSSTDVRAFSEICGRWWHTGVSMGNAETIPSYETPN